MCQARLVVLKLSTSFDHFASIIMDHSRKEKDERKYRKRSHSREFRDADGRDAERHRSRSPRQKKHRHGDKSLMKKLPFGSHHIHKNDFESYEALFVDYLDLQKGLDLDRLDEREVKGRWKSFLNKWNRGELAEGWYDPATKERADARCRSDSERQQVKSPRAELDVPGQPTNHISAEEEDDDDGYGPALPEKESTTRIGPAIPSFQDIQQRRELNEEDREARIADLRYERKQDRNIQKERLEELVPRAEPGSHERQLEKKRETTSTNRAFAEAKETGTEEVADGDLLGDDGGDAYKAKMKAMERQKNEREIRKEEVLRARAAEREEKLAEHRRKEAKTMEMLRTIAQQRYGDGS